MAMLINDPRIEDRLREQRQAWGADHHDEVWEGVYVMAPLPNDEHQKLVLRLGSILDGVLGWTGLGEVRPGVNLTGREDDWRADFRAPDVTVFLRGGAAENRDTHWLGPADFLVEIISPGDRTREKLPFYERLGVREVLIVDRYPWAIELYRRQEAKLVLARRSDAEQGGKVASEVVPLVFELLPGHPRPALCVTHPESGRTWRLTE